MCDTITFAQRLATFRRERGLTQQALAGCASACTSPSCALRSRH